MLFSLIILECSWEITKLLSKYGRSGPVATHVYLYFYKANTLGQGDKMIEPSAVAFLRLQLICSSMKPIYTDHLNFVI